MIVKISSGLVAEVFLGHTFDWLLNSRFVITMLLDARAGGVVVFVTCSMKA